MATNDSTEKRQLSFGEREQLETDINLAGMLFLSIQEWARNTDAEVNLTAVEAMCEKGGFLTDRCASLLGSTAINGPFEEWAGLDRPTTEAAGEANHG